MRHFVRGVLVFTLLAPMLNACPTDDDDVTADDDTGDDDDDDSAGDADGDGWTVSDGDCDDSDPTSYPGADEVCDGADNDCDGDTDEGLNDDGDGDGFTECDGDCDDGNPGAFPGPHWEPSPDGVDANCDGADAVRVSMGDVLLLAEPGGTSPSSVSSAGDVDADGFADVLVGVSSNDDSAQGAGKTYLMFGSTIRDGGEFELASADATFLGESPDDASGWAVASGDVDGDGHDDVMIGALRVWDDGAVYIVRGSRVVSGGEFELADADIVLHGHEESGTGYAVASAGDVDGDGLADVLIGAPYRTDALGSVTGAAFVVLAAAVQSGGHFSSGAWGGAMLVGEDHLDHAGALVASAGDVDGDGRDDVLIGATGHDGGNGEGWGLGSAYLMFGPSVTGALNAISLDGADAVFQGVGASVSSAGDLDGDGLADIMIGSPSWGNGASGIGRVYLFLGADIRDGGPFEVGSAWSTLRGESPGAYAGDRVSVVGDVDGDGLPDIVVGSDSNDGWAELAGKSYLVTAESLRWGGDGALADAFATFVGDYHDRCGRQVSGAGDVNGDGLNDLIFGLGYAGGSGIAAAVLFSPYSQ